MAIPRYTEFFPTIMKFMGDGKLHSRDEIKAYSASAIDLTEEEQNMRYQKSGEFVVHNRIAWAISDLKIAGLLERPQRGIYKITDLGKELLFEHPERLNHEYLHQYGEFKYFSENYLKDKNGLSENSNHGNTQRQNIDLEKNLPQDPIEKIENAFKDIDETLCKDLLEETMKISAYDFESLVVKLLVKMGYGSEKFNEFAVTTKSCDEGIDGIVNADKFGFESIYIQAKRWNPQSTVGRPEIQKFLGALVGRGASKGLFITTAQFSREAIEYSKNQHTPRIVLVNGKYLTELMLEYDIGVNISKIFKLKRIDSEFFNENIRC